MKKPLKSHSRRHKLVLSKSGTHLTLQHEMYPTHTLDQEQENEE